MKNNIYDFLVEGFTYSSDKEAFGMSHHFEKREQAITKYIESTSKSYATRLKTRSVFQVIISILLLVSLVAFAAMFIFVIIYSLLNRLNDLNVIISLIGSAGAFISSLFGLLIIVVKYIFPKSDDENSKELLRTAIEIDASYYDKNMNRKQNNLSNEKGSDKDAI